MSSYQPELTLGAAEASQPSPKGKRIGQRFEKGKSGQEQPPAFSPWGRHSVLRGLLLRVGDALKADEDGSLSKVSLQGLRSALSDFLQETRDVPGRASSAGTTSGRSSRAAGNRGDDLEKQRQRAVKRAANKALAERLRRNLYGVQG